MRNKIVALLLLTVTILTTFTSVYAATFPDVAIDHWARYYIEKMQAKNIINGYEDGSFKPENLVTTGEFIKMVAMSYYPGYQYVAPEPDDIGGTHWSRPYVLVLNNQMLMAREYNDERLERIITRGETTSILAYLYKTSHYSDSNNNLFDADETYIDQLTDEADITDSNMRSFINYCIKNGIINGFPDGSFRKDEGLTRAQAAKMIYYARYSL